MLNNIADNLEQCGQQNIVQCCFHQARTGCSFFAVYNRCVRSNMLYIYINFRERPITSFSNTLKYRNRETEKELIVLIQI